MLEPSFLFGQFMSGLVAAMFLFLIASGLSLIFGVLGLLNFAHGSFYMLGAYLAWQVLSWLNVSGEAFWVAALTASLGVALISYVVERLLFRRLYGRDPLYQLLLSYAVVLVLADATRFAWGTNQLSISRPPSLAGSSEIFGAIVPHYNLFIVALGFSIAGAGWLALHKTALGRTVRAAAIDREMLGALGADVEKVYSWVFVTGSFLAGLSGALVTPIKNITPGMDVDIIVEVFIIVVIGGLGSLTGTLVGSLIFGQVLAFGILVLPGFSLFAVSAFMAAVLVVRPAGLFGRPTQR